jgi:hypothetical protein
MGPGHVCLHFQHGEHGGHTEFHEDFRGQQPDRPIGAVRRFQALRAKRNTAFLRETPWILRVLRVENAVANPPPPIPVGTLIVAVRHGLTSVEVSFSTMIAGTK